MEESEQGFGPLGNRWGHTGLGYKGEEDSRGTVHDGDDGDDYHTTRNMSGQHLVSAYCIPTAY